MAKKTKSVVKKVIKSTNKVVEKSVKASNTIKVKNAEGDPDTTAKILVQNKIDYTPKVSVIIPVYNVEKYLRECLDSVINQTLKEIEIICVDDGSTDSSLDILKEYAAKDNRITVITQINSYCNICRNNAIKIATGDYIGFIDSDDYINTCYYEDLYNAAKQNDADIAATYLAKSFDGHKFGDKNVGISKNKNSLVSLDEKSSIVLNSGVSWNKIYRRSFVNKNHIIFYPTLSEGGDNYFTCMSVILCNKIEVCSKACYFYRQVVDSIVHKEKTPKSLMICDVYKAILDDVKLTSLSEDIKRFWTKVVTERFCKNLQYIIPYCNKDLKEQFINKSRNVMPQIIISLTSYPARIETVNQTIETLLNQTLKADKVILWLAPEQFPNREADLPEQLAKLQKQGLTIGWYHDVKSYKKLIPALQKYPDAMIITTDDDVLYDKNMVKSLYESFLTNPNNIHCHRAHKITTSGDKINKYRQFVWFTKLEKQEPASFRMFFTGVGGVLYPPHCLGNNVLNEAEFMSLCPRGDDIWFWANAVLNNVKIKITDIRSHYTIIDGTQETALWLTNQTENDVQLANVLGKYPKILSMVLSQQIKSKGTFKQYVLFPYYLFMTIWMNLISLPLAKFKRHIGRIMYSHSRRGHTDQIMQCIQSVKNDIQKQFDYVKDDMNKQTKTMEIIKDGVNKQTNTMEIIKDGVNKQTKTMEIIGCLYRYDRQTRWAIEHGMTDITNAPNFEKRFMKLIDGMPFESKATITNIITRLQLIKDGGHHDLFNEQEKRLLKQVTDFENSVLKISDDKFWCNGYLLPINHFEASVFFYKHGLDKLENPKYFQNKAILDIGAYIGDSALILSPLTKNKVYCFEGCQENYDNMLKTIEMNNLKNIVPVKSAVGDFDGEIELFYYGGATSTDKNMVTRSTRSEKTKIIRVDDYIKEHKINVGLIKVDIEGAEQSFLRGARKTIEKYKPTLLISIYHNVDDFLDIKPMIESWNLGYKFKVFKPTIGSVSAETLLICEQ